VLEYWVFHHSITPLLHYSITSLPRLSAALAFPRQTGLDCAGVGRVPVDLRERHPP
jgi:hypothetical protein